MPTRSTSVLAAVLVLAPTASAQLFGSEVGADRLSSIDAATLTATDIGAYSANQFDLNGLAGGARGLFGLDAGSGTIFNVDPDTAAAVAITGNVFGGNANGLAYDANRDRLWVSNNGGLVSFYDFGTNTTGVIGTASINNLEGLAFNAATDTLYALSDTDDRLYTLDTTSLAATAISPALEGGNWRGLAYDSSTNRLIASRVGGGSSFLAEFDLTQGMVVNSGNLSGVGQFVQGLAYVPTPASGTVLALGGLMTLRRKRA